MATLEHVQYDQGPYQVLFTYLFICVFVCVGQASDAFLNHFYTFFFEIGSLTDPRTPSFGYTNWPESPRPTPVSAFLLLGLLVHATLLDLLFHRAAQGPWTQALVCMASILSRLSHLSSPNFNSHDIHSS